MMQAIERRLDAVDDGTQFGFREPRVGCGRGTLYPGPTCDVLSHFVEHSLVKVWYKKRARPLVSATKPLLYEIEVQRRHAQRAIYVLLIVQYGFVALQI